MTSCGRCESCELRGEVRGAPLHLCAKEGLLRKDGCLCAAKHAQVGLVRQLAHELGPFGITVNSVAPGFVRSNPSSDKQWLSYDAAKQAQILRGISTRRLGTPQDIAHAVLYFASNMAAWCTGQCLEVNGGN